MCRPDIDTIMLNITKVKQGHVFSLSPETRVPTVAKDATATSAGAALPTSAAAPATAPASNATTTPTTTTAAFFNAIPPQLNQPQKRTRNRVSFKETCNVSLIEACSCMSEQERNVIWYQTTDIDEFRSEARTVCRRLRDSPPSKCRSNRGLEHRVCLERQRNKHVAIRCVIKAQTRSRCPDFIAMVSGKCTAWAKEIAVAEASRDFCDVYYPDLLDKVPKVAKSSFPLPVRKRDGDDTELGRKVKSRTDESP